ncbi:hypothetical protein [Streptosporangium amethystogenes]|uniref:hypothetical protein n=1 Tax=Streptosporangium amethystogenes TaxID=2002 RepID=UPI0004C70B32|nr:hypothetical protein [Streptosporangium amethystogenes]
MIPPAGERPHATGWHPGAVAALKHLRTELHTHRIYPAISYDHGRPRLAINTDLTVWADTAGTVFCWGPRLLEEPAEQAPADDLPQVAHRIAGRLGEHYAEPTDPP